jgi:capsule biosynthesis phosphatase
MKKIVIDLDHTTSFKETAETYENARPNYKVIEKIAGYKQLGYQICIFTARNMRTYDNNLGLINANTLPIT